MLQDKINNNLKLPIDFADTTYELPNNIINELELLKNKDPSQNSTVYNSLFKNDFINKKIISKYTTDTKFLTDTQEIIEKLSDSFLLDDNFNKAWNSFKDIKEDSNFLDKYQYINFDTLDFLNKSTPFLTIYSLYSIASPILNVLSPIVLLIIPFITLKLKNIPITMDKYINTLVSSIKTHSFGKLITQWSHMSWGQRSYMLALTGLYVYNIYQNITSCISFFHNTYTINNNIQNIKLFLKNISIKINKYLDITNKYTSYSNYKTYLQKKLENINSLYNKLDNIPLASFNPSKITHLGYTMKQYYTIYSSDDIEKTLLFSFGFDSYLQNITDLSNLYKDNILNKAKIISSNKTSAKFRDIFNPNVQSDNIVKNSIDMKNNKLITGPNASGKTTLIKTILTNIIITQQFGIGFYKKAALTPFDFFHCYINIPDTSSRDSLFQAEARQCLNIINCISNNPNKKHFCIFDELFSGTNPYEAISSAKSYIEFIMKYDTVKFMLTTHFVELCDKLKDNKCISNINMKTKIINEKQTYTYKIQKGISKIKGGITVLKNLKYPNIIIQNTEKKS